MPNDRCHQYVPSLLKVTSWGYHRQPTLLIFTRTYRGKANSDYFKGLATQYSQKLCGVTLFKNINVYTATNSGLLSNTQVAVKDGKIIVIGQATKGLNANRIVDGKGKTLMPGLWDMHTHISINDGILNIINGVTSVRDLANKHEDVMQATELFGSGEASGPSIYRAGFIDQKALFQRLLEN